MKKSILWLSAALLAVAFELPAQPRRGGPGGQPCACCDQNRDGVCDRCGRKAGSGQGRGGCCRRQQQSAPATAPAQPGPNR